MAKIEENQLIFIPGAYAVKEIILESEETEDDFIWPVKGKVITYFRERNSGHNSKGVDIKTPPGTIVKAARTGKVVFSDYLSGYGETVILDHLDGYHSVYAMNSKLLVKLGQYVIKDSPISEVGRNDKLSYLHFQIRRHSVEDNPLYYLP